jgi:hypothetical protein
LEGLEYDANRQRVVLVRGAGLFDWDGSDWVGKTATGDLPVVTSGYAVAYSPAQSDYLLFGGLANGQRLGDTYVLNATNQPQVQSYGSPCPGSTGSPALAAANTPLVGNSRFELDLTGGIPGNQAIVGVGLNTASIPFGGCNILVGGLLGLLVSYNNAAGVSSVTFGIPYQPALAGTQIFSQGISIDPGVPAFFSATQGLRLRIGD